MINLEVYMDSSNIGTYMESVRVSSSDTASALPSACMTYIQEYAGTPAVSATKYYKAVTISVETYDIRGRYDANPTQGASAAGHVYAKDTSFRVLGKENIANFRYISKTSGQHAVLQISPEK
jgi:predicted Zn-dependent protease